MRFILLGLAAAVLGDRNKGGVSCGPQDLEEGEVVVGCVKRYECESPDGAWHLCPNEVVKVCGKKDGEEKTYQNQCMADCDGAEPANGGNWEQGVPCTEDIELSDAKCGLLDNKRVACEATDGCMFDVDWTASAVDAWSEDADERLQIDPNGQTNKENGECWGAKNCAKRKGCYQDENLGGCFELQCWDITDEEQCKGMETCAVVSTEEQEAMSDVDSMVTYPEDPDDPASAFKAPVCEPIMYRYEGIEGMATSCFNIQSPENCNREVLDDGETQQCTWLSEAAGCVPFDPCMVAKSAYECQQLTETLARTNCTFEDLSAAETAEFQDLSEESAVDNQCSNGAAFCCFTDFTQSNANADSFDEGKFAMDGFDVGMDQTVGCWNIDNETTCNAEMTLTNDQACQWGEAVSTSNCELGYDEDFTEERWELCDMQQSKDDCDANDCDYISFTEDAICAPFSKCTNAESGSDPQNACKKLQGCDWIAYDSDFADAGLDAPGGSDKTNGYCVHNEYIEEEEWGDVAANGTCLFDVETIGIEADLTSGFFGGGQESDDATVLCRSITSDFKARGSTSGSASSIHFTAESTPKEVCNSIYTVDGKQECEWIEGDANKGSKCAAHHLDPAEECAQYTDDWKCQASDTCRFKSVDYLAGKFDSTGNTAETVDRHVYDDTCAFLANAQDCESETRPGPSDTLIRACIMAEVQSTDGECESTVGGTVEVENPCSLQCIPFNACLLHVTEEECKTEQEFCGWTSTGGGNNGKRCRSIGLDDESGGVQDSKTFQDEMEYCFSKASIDDCQSTADDRGPSCSWVISPKFSECKAGLNLLTEDDPEGAAEKCNIIDLKKNLLPRDREQLCTDDGCVVDTTEIPQQYCARVRVCGRQNNDVECLGLGQCSWDYVDQTCTEADENEIDDREDVTDVLQPSLSRALECYAIPSSEACAALTFRHKSSNTVAKEEALCEWISDGEDADSDSDAACNCYGLDKDAMLGDTTEDSVQKTVYDTCMSVEGRHRKGVNDYYNDDRAGVADCMEATCNDVAGCQWMVKIGSTNSRCDVSTAWNKIAAQIKKEDEVDSLFSDAFFNCVDKTTYSSCLGQFDEDGGQLCTWENWGDWDEVLGEIETDAAPGDCRVYDQCNVDNRYRCEQVGCSWRPFGNNLQDAYAGECARKPSESYQGDKEDKDLWKMNFECVPFYADDFTATTSTTTTAYTTESATSTTVTTDDKSTTTTTTTTMTTTTTTSTTTTTTTIYNAENVDCVESWTLCTAACESEAERGYTLTTASQFKGKACNGNKACEPGEGGCPAPTTTNPTTTTKAGGGGGMGGMGGNGGGMGGTPSPNCEGADCGKGGGDGDGQGTGDKDGMGDKNEASDNCEGADCGKGGGDGDGQGTGDKDGMGDKMPASDSPAAGLDPVEEKKKNKGLIAVVVILVLGLAMYYTVRCKRSPKAKQTTTERFLNPLADGSAYAEVQANDSYSFGIDDDDEVYDRSSSA